MHPELHLGITPWQLGPALDAGSLCRQAVQAEAWGFDSFFLPESHFSAASPIPDPMLLLAAVAARTRSIRLGTTSYLLPIRHPVLAAEQVASLDRLSGGRLILGLGRGYQPAMLGVFGVTNADKRQRFSETLEAMLAAWRGDPLHGEDPDVMLVPRPLQQPHPPLWVAGLGPRAIAQIGSLGLPYLASPMETLDELRENVRLHGEALAQHDQRAPDTLAIMRTVFISEDRTRLAAVRKKLAGLPPPPFRPTETPPPEDWCLLGSRREVAEQIGRYRDTLGISHLIAVRPRVGGLDEDWLLESMAALAELTGRCAPDGISGAC